MRTETLSLTSLLVDSRNPRLELHESQQETLQAIIEQQGEKLTTLAQDILKHGLNPADLPIVTPSEKHAGRYIVLEGNRRIAALRLLASPELILDAQTELNAATWRRMAEGFAEAPIDTVSCSVAETREEAEHWIRLRHTGENQGAGIVPWGATETARFEERQGKLRVELQVLDFVRADPELPEEVRNNLSNVAITNLGRLLSDPEVRSRLGIERDNRQILTALPDSEVIRGLRRIISDLALRKIKVSDIETKKERQQYLDDFSKDELPDLSTSTGEAVALRDAPKGKGKSTKPKVKPTPRSHDRHELIPRDYVVQLKTGKINNIFHELRRLKPRNHPNACAVLLRVFLELSVDDYLDRKSLHDPLSIHDQAKLADKVFKLAEYLADQGMLTDEELKPIRRAVSSDNLLAASIPTLHAYVHSLKLNPDPDSLKAAWDSLQPFLDTILPKD